MTFENLASINLSVAAIVVGIVLPLAGIFAFGLLRSDVEVKTHKILHAAIEDGVFHKQVEDAIAGSLTDPGGKLREYISDAVTGAFGALNAQAQINSSQAQSQTNQQNQSPGANKISWGNEADEHGDIAPQGGA